MYWVKPNILILHFEFSNLKILFFRLKYFQIQNIQNQQNTQEAPRLILSIYIYNYI
jgi:hypothetical protein